MAAGGGDQLPRGLRAWLGQEKDLSPGFAAACGLGFLDRAEPASALADLHLDLGVPAALGRMVDAFTGAVDIALDRTVRRGRDRPGRRGHQHRMGVWRRFGCAEDRGLLVADAPVPWRDEGALPHPGLGFTRRFLVRLVFLGT